MSEQLVSLPKTAAAIAEQFAGADNAGLRRELIESAKYGSVLPLSRRIALTASGRAGLGAVQEVLTAEYAARGYDRCHVGDGDPSVYGAGAVVAYLDQPIEQH